MSNIALKVENLSKQYRLGVVGASTLRADVARWIAKVRGKEDPTLKIGETNTLNTMEGEYVWALQDINFEVKQGEVLGIIGKNGAGKSTLLKILSKVTGPTTGSIKTKGRIASLLEVGTGMHPELTGRENIFLNGAILGMTKAEVRKKLDEIVDFAGIAKYVDTPIKRYSSGMSVRLGFAVAAFLEPEILIVDEVLAVGDAEFQKKAIGKMKDVSQGEGRTVLFVSHNMASIRKLCNKALLLKQGEIYFEGTVSETISKYVQINTNLDEASNFNSKMTNDNIELEKFVLTDGNGNSKSNFDIQESIKVTSNFRVLKKFNNLLLVLRVFTQEDISVMDIFSTDTENIDKQTSNDKDYIDISPITSGIYNFNVSIPEFLLNEGQYYIVLYFVIPRSKGIIAEYVYPVLNIEDNQASYTSATFKSKRAGVILSNIKPDLIKNKD